MRRRPETEADQVRPDWVYVGAVEAAVLGDVSHHAIERWVASGELVPARVEREGQSGRRRHLYRLDKVLALARNSRR